jgi:hypothetical protein
MVQLYHNILYELEVFSVHGVGQNLITVWVSSVNDSVQICMSFVYVKGRNKLLNAVFFMSGKVVTFGGADHYAEETPLMFSRCSSLCSLSSIEQHSIHDDRSSVISDFR